MDKNKDLILNSLKYYDINNEKYANLFTRAKYYNLIRPSNDLEYNIIIFYDKNKKEFFKSRYELVGCYYIDISVWAWSWILPTSNKNEYEIAKKLLNYGLDLGNEFKFLKLELINSRFRISSEIQLDIHISLASYISKMPLIFKLPNPPISSVQIENSSSGDNEIFEIGRDNKDWEEIYYLYLLDEFKLD
jgi:hypothetical protein